jgi:hypothetical protein
METNRECGCENVGGQDVNTNRATSAAGVTWKSKCQTTKRAADVEDHFGFLCDV